MMGLLLQEGVALIDTVLNPAALAAITEHFLEVGQSRSHQSRCFSRLRIPFKNI